jgi:hypothetical protein
MPKTTQTKHSRKVEEVEEVEEVVEEVEDAEELEDADEVVSEVDPEDEGIDLHDDDEDETATKKRSKKIEYTCESAEQALAELDRIESEIEQLQKQRKAVFKTYKKLILKQLKKSKKSKNKNSDTQKEATGFIKAKFVPEKFKSFYEQHLKNDESFKKIFTNFDITVDQPRTDITKMIYHYIRTNNLYQESEDKEGEFNKRIIKPNKHLTDLLSIKSDESIGFNNFQTYVSRLYTGNEQEVTEQLTDIVSKSKKSTKQSDDDDDEVDVKQKVKKSQVVKSSA